MMRIARHTFVLPLLLGAGLLVGCGDDTATPKTTPKTTEGPSGTETPDKPSDDAEKAKIEFRKID